MGRPDKYPWTKITADFVTGTMSVRACSLFWRVPFHTMRARYTKYKWKQKRKEYQAKLYQEILAMDIEEKKASMAVVQEKARSVLGNVLERLEELGEHSRPSGGLSPENAKELAELRKMVTGNQYMEEKQAERLFKLSEMEADSKRTGMDPNDVEKTLKSTDLAMGVAERALGLQGVQPTVDIRLRYVPDYLRNRDQEGED